MPTDSPTIPSTGSRLVDEIREHLRRETTKPPMRCIDGSGDGTAMAPHGKWSL